MKVANCDYYAFKLHSCFLLVDIHQLILKVQAVVSFPPNVVNYSTELSKKRLLDANYVTASRRRKLQNSKNGLQQFGKLITRVFLLQIFSCIYRCFECIIKQLLDLAHAYQELARPWSILSASAFGSAENTDLSLNNP